MGELGDHPEARNHRRYGVPRRWYQWGRYHRRFDVSLEPHEPNRFGWVVEIDPLDPASRPVKRTALGRFKREGAGNVINRDGRLVVYSGDDEAFNYIYRFSSAAVATTRRTGRPTATSSTTARSRSRASGPTVRSSGGRSSGAKGYSRRPTTSRARPTS
jgi:secreted PhoX family phosphatase